MRFAAARSAFAAGISRGATRESDEPHLVYREVNHLARVIAGGLFLWLGGGYNPRNVGLVDCDILYAVQLLRVDELRACTGNRELVVEMLIKVHLTACGLTGLLKETSVSCPGDESIGGFKVR